jgi:hypothetical protein
MDMTWGTGWVTRRMESHDTPSLHCHHTVRLRYGSSVRISTVTIQLEEAALRRSSMSTRSLTDATTCCKHSSDFCADSVTLSGIPVVPKSAQDLTQ